MNTISRWTKRFADGDFDQAPIGSALFGLAVSVLLVISILMETQP